MERLIKTEAEYEAALAKVESLMHAKAGTEELDRLEYWSRLVEIYEDEHYPIPQPTPLEAIEFAMDQQGLSRRDLEPFIGSKGVVSEVLAGKRRLTLEMIRRLHAGLGIPLDTLIQDLPSDPDPDPDPCSALNGAAIKEMVKRGWLEAVAGADEMRAQAGRWLEQVGFASVDPAFCARSSTRLGMRGDASSVLAWVGGLRCLASATPQGGVFDRAALDHVFFKGLLELSTDPRGPAFARDYLARFGVCMVVLKHFPKTYQDGAALFVPDGRAVVGLSLRFDRLDNFWFTLLHELAHLALGHVEPGGFMVDELDARTMDDVEKQANAFAADVAIPSELWEATPAKDRTKPRFVFQTAEALKISPAIVAGRVRRETGNYKLFSRSVGSGEVRKLFPEWR